jgi:hypothetical protein
MTKKNLKKIIHKLIEIIREDHHRACFSEYSDDSGKCIRKLENDDHDCELCMEISKSLRG